MLNPVLSNFRVILGDEFFPEDVAKKYDDHLYAINYPLKTINQYIHETIQTISIPGINLQTIDVDSIANNRVFPPGSPEFTHTTHKEIYEGSSAYSNILTDNTITITFKNSILNWMYMFEYCYDHYKRVRDKNTKVGTITLLMYNSTEIPVLMFIMKRSFISSLPGLEFAFNSSFSESRTFDTVFTFNELDVKFVIPDFKQKTFSLNG